ncbi:MAG TPA: sugar phosphate isomerase/epimerase [Armatimonadota bacterium]|nr:sugar phosphate isomerase/epimerase [Armatimonadota bacterium]
MKLGCNTVVLGTTDFPAALQHVEWAGYKYVELAAIKGMCEHVRIGQDPAEIKDLLAKHSLEATAMEAATNDRERLMGLFALAREIGVPIVNIGSGGKTGDEESTRNAIQLMREFAKLAGEQGVKLAVKPHVGQAIYNAETGLRLVSEVNDPALGLNFDPSHLFRANETPEDVAPRWGSRIITSHFRDCPWREGSPGTPDQQIPGRGVVNIPATLAALKKSGYTGPLNLEVIGAGGWELSRAMGIVAEAHGYLNRCLQEIGV